MMFQLYLLNSHILHIIICLYICSVTHAKSNDLHKVMVHKTSWPEIHKSQKAGSDSYSHGYTESQVRMTIETHAHTFTHMCYSIHTIPSTKQALLPTLKHCTIHKKIYYRKQLHLPLMLNCMTLVFGEFIKSSHKQTVFYCSKDSDGGHSTHSCVYMETDTHYKLTKKYEHF